MEYFNDDGITNEFDLLDSVDKHRVINVAARSYDKYCSSNVKRLLCSVISKPKHVTSHAH